jgi:hypothetical protein
MLAHTLAPGYELFMKIAEMGNGPPNEVNPDLKNEAKTCKAVNLREPLTIWLSSDDILPIGP